MSPKQQNRKKRLLGKAQTRVKITSVIIENLTLTVIKDNHKITKQLKNISLGSFGDENGLDSNQLGGELLKQVLNSLINLDKADTIKK